jgi:ribosomal protein S18 acetylase RimI-like enzyme
MEPLHCHIREMSRDEERDLLLLAREVLWLLAEGHGHPERYHDEQFLELVERADVYVARPAEEDELVAGFVALEDEADDLVVRCLCVAPAFEAQRVAHQLLDWAEGLAYERSRRRIMAEVLRDDERTQHLYKGHAFVPTPAADRPELIVMEKRLVDR